MTITSLAPYPVFHADDGNGNPLSGGKLFTYAAGTTTKIATYTDSTGSTPNTNPIILNSRGECFLWLAQGIPYKLVLAPATDSDPPAAAIWTDDNVSAIPIGNTFNSVPVTVVTTGSTYVVQAVDYQISINKTAGSATTVNLPASPTTGRTLVIKDDKGDAATNNITVTPAAGNIDNAASYVIRTNRGSIITTYDGTQWEVTSYIAQSSNAFVYAGNPNGNVAGNAGTAGSLPPDLVWDTTNGEWWICTTSGVGASAVWFNEKLVSRTISGNTTVTGTMTVQGATIAAGSGATMSGTLTATGTIAATGATMNVATATALSSNSLVSSTQYTDNAVAVAVAAAVPAFLIQNAGVI